VYVQRHGIVPEATAKHFMQQLAAGLQVLRDNNIIHRDLKPQVCLILIPFISMIFCAPGVFYC
jgi:serine/threonine-protein kinase ULK/ATG1